MKRYYLYIVAVLIFIFLGSCTVKSGPIYLISLYSYQDDSAYNSLARDGLEYALEPYKDWIPEYRQVISEKSYRRTLQEAMNQGARLIISLDPSMGEYVNTLAAENLMHRFVIIDWVPPSSDDYLKNTAYITFREHEGGFMMGIAAAMATESGFIGFIAGEENDSTNSYLAGFKAGVEYINSDVVVLINYINTFNNEETAYNTALKLIESQADVIYHVTGRAGQGVARACKENKVWFIGNDRQQSIFTQEYTLTSMLKRVDIVVNNIITDTIYNDFPGGEVISLGTVDFALDYESTLTLTEEMIVELDDVKYMISTEELFVSDDPEAPSLYEFRD